MPTLHQTVVRPSGIVTQPNAAGELPPGTLKVGNGIMIRKPGVIQPRPGFETYSEDAPVLPAKVWPLPMPDRLDQVLVLDAADPEAADYSIHTSTTSTHIGNPFTNVRIVASAGMTQMSLARDRGILTSVYDESVDLTAIGGTRFRSPVVALPYPFDPLFTIVRAGLPPIAFVDAVGVSTGAAGDWFLTNNFVAYRIVHKRLFSDGYLLISAPSAPRVLFSGGDCTPELEVFPMFGGGVDSDLAEGDLLEVYRTPQVDALDLVGDRFQLAFTYKVTAADTTFVSITFRDTILENGLGANLYTNESEEGPSKANLMPPPSTDVITFKGATFYASRETQATLVSATSGSIADTSALLGLGSRTATGGTRTSGLAVVTGLANTTGMVAGQVVIDPPSGFPTGTTVVSVAGSTVTMSANATSSAAGTALLTTVDAVIVTTIEGSFTVPFATLADFIEEFNVRSSINRLGVLVSATRLVDYSDNDPATLVFTSPMTDREFSLQATNGQNWSPILPSPSETALAAGRDRRTNRVHFSKIDQPEHVPADNFLRVGKGTILRMFATQDSLFAFATDGIHRIEGDGDDWAVIPFDPNTVLLAPDAVDSMDNTIYALTTAGFVSFTDSGGVEKISNPLIGDDIRALEKQFRNATPTLPYTWGLQVACDLYRNEVWVNYFLFDDESEVWQQTYIWNNETSTFVTQSDRQPIALAYIPFLQSILTADPGDFSDETLRIYDTTGTLFMDTTIVFNEIFGEDLAGLKEWIDVTIFFEDLTQSSVDFLPQFEGVDYPNPYEIVANAGSFEHVVAPLLNATNLKHLRFGFSMTAGENPQPDFRMLGFYARYRPASETLRA